MAACFVCGCVIPKGTEIRRTVHTGSSVGGFNIFSNVMLNLLVNSLLLKRRQSVRSYYSTKTVCSSCDKNLAKRERRKAFGLLLFSITFFLLVGIILVSRH
jgi:predicted nucleic acid-binding Zn ribbon protein